MKISWFRFFFNDDGGMAGGSDISAIFADEINCKVFLLDSF